jgi:hypothetical protein
MSEKQIPQAKVVPEVNQIEVLKAQLAAAQEELKARTSETAVDGFVHGIESNVKARVTLANGSVRLDY